MLTVDFITTKSNPIEDFQTIAEVSYHRCKNGNTLIKKVYSCPKLEVQILVHNSVALTENNNINDVDDCC